MGNKNFSATKLSIKTSAIGLEKHYFYYDQGMQKHWILANAAFMNYVGSKYSQSDKVSIMVGKLVITKVDETLVPKFKTEEAKNNHLDKLEY